MARIPELLDQHQEGLTRTELLAKLFHYRVNEGMLLHFSIQECLLLKDHQFDQADALLRAVLKELNAELARKETQELLVKVEKQRNITRQRELAFAPPPQPPARVIGSTFGEQLMKAQEAAIRAITQPSTEYLFPGTTIEHPLIETRRELEKVIDQYPSSIWRKLPQEQSWREDHLVQREYDRRKQTVNRAVTMLRRENRIVDRYGLLRLKAASGDKVK